MAFKFIDRHFYRRCGGATGEIESGGGIGDLSVLDGKLALTQSNDSGIFSGLLKEDDRTLALGESRHAGDVKNFIAYLPTYRSNGDRLLPGRAFNPFIDGERVSGQNQFVVVGPSSVRINNMALNNGTGLRYEFIEGKSPDGGRIRKNCVKDDDRKNKNQPAVFHFNNPFKTFRSGLDVIGSLLWGKNLLTPFI